MGSIREMTRKDGTKSYHAEVRMKGHSVERATFRNRTLAKKWIQDIESGIRDGRHFKHKESRQRTVNDLVERFTSTWLARQPQRIKKQSALLAWWLGRYGHLLLDDFTPSVIAEGRDCLLSETTCRGSIRSPATVNRYLSALGKALTIAEKEWGWIEMNPARKVSRCKESAGRERYLSKEEKRRLLEECRKSRNPNLYPMVLLSLMTGMRYGELSGLLWSDIDFDHKTVVLRNTKNGDTRYLPLTEEMEQEFRGLRTYGQAGVKLVFQSHRNHLVEKRISVREAFEAALRCSGIEHFRWHDLRHTAASYIAMSGGTQGELMAILGHKSPQMTKRYTHYSDNHIRAVLEKANKGKSTKKGMNHASGVLPQGNSR